MNKDFYGNDVEEPMCVSMNPGLLSYVKFFNLIIYMYVMGFEFSVFSVQHHCLSCVFVCLAGWLLNQKKREFSCDLGSRIPNGQDQHGLM